MRTALLISLALLASTANAANEPQLLGRTTEQVLSAAKASDWRDAALENTLYLDLPQGRVVMELAPAFAPAHAEAIKTLAERQAFDGSFIGRMQENYVVQWGQREGTEIADNKPLPVELFAAPAPSTHFAALADGDLYAPQVGFADGFPSARDADGKRAWLTHCYSMLGVGRGDAANSSTGGELYVVIGHAPRHLDKNVVVVGRVLAGMPLLGSLPRGSGPLGFYSEAEAKAPITRIRRALDVPAAERTHVQVLRTDTPLWQAYVDSRRTRREPWFVDPVGRVELCNVLPPVRPRP